MVTCCVLRADCYATSHDHADRAEVPKHRHVLQFALSTVFGHVKISQSEAVFLLFFETVEHMMCACKVARMREVT